MQYTPSRAALPFWFPFCRFAYHTTLQWTPPKAMGKSKWNPLQRIWKPCKFLLLLSTWPIPTNGPVWCVHTHTCCLGFVPLLHANSHAAPQGAGSSPCSHPVHALKVSQGSGSPSPHNIMAFLPALLSSKVHLHPPHYLHPQGCSSCGVLEGARAFSHSKPSPFKWRNRHLLTAPDPWHPNCATLSDRRTPPAISFLRMQIHVPHWC